MHHMKYNINNREKETSQKRYFVSSYDKQHIFKEIIAEFKEWSPWQKRQLLCVCVRKSSTQFLKAFNTTLEPLFHRDYQILFNSGFKSELIQHHDFEEMSKFTERAEKSTPEHYRKVIALSTFLTPKKSNKTESVFDQVTNLEKFCFQNGAREINHSHVLQRKMGSLSSIDFFPADQVYNSQALGKYVKPTSRQIVGSTLKDFKQEKLWLPPVKNNCILQRVSMPTALQNFNQTVNEFTMMYCKWNNAEKGEFYLNLLEYCSSSEIKFLFECIMKRITDVTDISQIPDKNLLKIFSLLNTNDLTKSVPLVCKHWHRLSNDKLLWQYKVHAKHIALNQAQKLKHIDNSCDDWKKLYFQVRPDDANKNKIEELSKLPQSPVHINDTYSFDLEKFIYQPPVDENLSLSSLNHETEDENDDSFVLESSLSNRNESTSTVRNSIVKSNIESEQLGTITENPSNNTDFEDEDEGEKAVDVRQKLIQPKDINNDKDSSVYQTTLKEKNYESEFFAQMPIVGLKAIKRVRKLEGHHDAVLCVQFGSKRIMTGSSDRTVRLWDARSGRNFQILYGHQGGVRCLQFDKNYIITGSWDTTVMIWDVVDFSVIKTLTEHKDCVSSLEVSSTILVTGSHDNTICIYSKHSWQLLGRLQKHQGPVSCLHLIADDQLLSGSHDRTIILWDVYKQSSLATFSPHQASVLCLKLSGKLLAAGCADGTLAFWNIATGTQEGVVQAHGGHVNSICFAASKFFTGGSDGKIKEWDLSTCTCLRSLTGHSGSVLCLRVSNKRIISGSSDGTARLWDFTCSFQQYGGPYEDMNKIVIPPQVMNEYQYEKMMIK